MVRVRSLTARTPMTGKKVDKIILPPDFYPCSPVKQIESSKAEKNHTAYSMVMACTFMSLYREKVWQLPSKIDAGEKILTVGKYPLMTLQEARDKAWTARKRHLGLASIGKSEKRLRLTTIPLAPFTKEWYGTKKNKSGQ